MLVSENLGFIESILFGIIQGLTEFLPISSDGHLVLGRELLSYHKEILVYDVLLHFGTLCSLVVFFRKDVKIFLNECAQYLAYISKNPKLSSLLKPEFRWTFYILLTTFVTGLIGLIFEEVVAETFTSLRIASIGFLITSSFLFLGIFLKKENKSFAELPLYFPILFGLAQAAALLPGVSRSGMTIATALLFGLPRGESGRFSFVVAIPIIFLATLYQARHLVHTPSDQLPQMFVGVAVSFVVGLLAIGLLLWMLQRQKLWPFAIYTLLLGLFGLFWWGS